MATTPQDILDQTVAAVLAYRTDAEAALNSITDVVNATVTYRPTIVGTPDLASVDDIAPPTLRDIAPTTITLTDPNRNPYTPLTTGQPQYQQATLDAGTSAAFATQLQALVPTLFQWLEDEVQSIVSTGGQNIVVNVQDAIFNQGLERSQQILRDALDMVGARTGSKGFRKANSQLSTQQNELVKNWQNSREDVNRKIIETMANFAQANIINAVNAGVNIDQAKVSVFTQTRTALADIQRLALEQYRTDLQNNMQVFEKLLGLQDLNLRLQVADREEMRAFISMQREQLALDSQIRRSEYEARASRDIKQVDLEKAVQELRVTKNEQVVRLWAAYVQEVIENSRLSLTETQERNRLRVTAAEGIAKTYTDLITCMGVETVALVKP